MTSILSTAAFVLGLLLYGGATLLFYLEVVQQRGAKGTPIPLGPPTRFDVRNAPLLLAVGALGHAAYVALASFVAHVCPIHSVHFLLSVSVLFAIAVYLTLRRRFRVTALVLLGATGLLVVGVTARSERLAQERARFAATDALVTRTFGRVASILEIGCGEGHQTRHFTALADQVYGIDVSAKAVERARVAVPSAQFAATDIFTQPWGDERGRFDLVTACEVMYYMKDVDATIARMSQLGHQCLVTFFSPALRRLSPHLDRIPNLQKDWMFYGGTVWLACWWRNE